MYIYTYIHTYIYIYIVYVYIYIYTYTYTYIYIYCVCICIYIYIYIDIYIYILCVYKYIYIYTYSTLEEKLDTSLLDFTPLFHCMGQAVRPPELSMCCCSRSSPGGYSDIMARSSAMCQQRNHLPPKRTSNAEYLMIELGVILR